MESRDEISWEQEYACMMETARKHLDPSWKFGQVLVLKTAKGNVYVAQIPDAANTAQRESLENRCIRQMQDAQDTEAYVCLATFKGTVPEIPSWNFRSRLIEVNKSNLQTMCFLGGGGENIHLKPFSRLL